MSADFSNGYWILPQNVPWAEVEKFASGIQRRTAEDKPILVREGVRFVELNQRTVPKAICTYCGQVNLQTSYECRKCGAPLVE